MPDDPLAPLVPEGDVTKINKIFSSLLNDVVDPNNDILYVT